MLRNLGRLNINIHRRIVNSSCSFSSSSSILRVTSVTSALHHCQSCQLCYPSFGRLPINLGSVGEYIRYSSSSSTTSVPQSQSGKPIKFFSVCWNCNEPIFEVKSIEALDPDQFGMKELKRILRVKVCEEIAKFPEFPIECPQCSTLQSLKTEESISVESKANVENINMEKHIIHSALQLYMNNYFEIFDLHHKIEESGKRANEEFFPFKYNLFADEDKANKQDSEMIQKDYVKKKLIKLQKKLHPDLFTQKSGKEREIREEFSAYVNKGLSILSSPTKRGVYLLQLINFAIKTLTDEEKLIHLLMPSTLDKARETGRIGDGDDDLLNIRIDDTEEVGEKQEFLVDIMEVNERLEELEQSWESSKDDRETLAESLREFQEKEIHPNLEKYIRETELLFAELIKDLNRIVDIEGELTEEKDRRADKKQEEKDSLVLVVPALIRQIKSQLVKLKYYERLQERVGKILYNN